MKKNLVRLLCISTTTFILMYSFMYYGIKRNVILLNPNPPVTSNLKNKILFDKLPPSNSLLIDVEKMKLTSPDMTLSQLLNIWADSESKSVILVYVDQAYLDMALNFIEISILPNRIKNILVMSSTDLTCEIITYMGVPCHVFRNKRFENTRPDAVSSYGENDFKTKCKIRMEIIQSVIKLGYNVLHSDSDIIFVKNPLLTIDKTCMPGKCDIAYLMDHDRANAGFIYIRSTSTSLQLYQIMIDYVISNPAKEDQDALYYAIPIAQKIIGLKHLSLKKSQFLSGKIYFTKMNHFSRSVHCRECIVIHNNWILGKEAKVYRFKEHTMWHFDEDKYYSAHDRKYILYSNPKSSNYSTGNVVNAIRNAFIIANILNRTVILPKFQCGAYSCNFLSCFDITALDREFKNEYREHMFLNHPKVPSSIKTSGDQWFIISKVSNTDQSRNEKVLVPSDCNTGIQQEDIIQWFTHTTQPVISLHGLHEWPEVILTDGRRDYKLKEKLNNGIVLANNCRAPWLTIVPVGMLVMTLVVMVTVILWKYKSRNKYNTVKFKSYMSGVKL